MKSQSIITSSILIFILFAVSFVTAEIQVNTYTPSKDFTLTSAFNEVSICSCSTKYDSISITNIGTWPAIFTISTNELKSKLTLSQNAFELQPGQSQEVFLYITADCTRGNEDLQITITSNLGTQKTLEKKIVRDRCQNIEMWINNYTKDISPCDSKSFEINVHNIGPFADSYTLSSNYDDYVTYNTNAFNLETNQFAKISATAKFGCEVYGQKDIIFTVHSAKNKLTASLNAQLNIEQDYDYDLKINKENSDSVNTQICNRVYTTQVPVSITNKGSVANEYTIEINNLPKFAKTDLTDKIFSLKPKETKTFYIYVDSSNYRSEVKTKEVSIKVNSKYGDINKESKLLLNYGPCYEHEVIIHNADNSQSSALKTCADYDYSYDVDIVNKGTFTETYKLSLEGVPSTVKLSKDKITIEPGQKSTIRLLVKGPDYNAYYNIKVRATISNGLSEYDNTWVKSYDTQSCHATTVGKSNFKINYQTKEISIPITNNGIVDNRYTIMWEGSKIIDNDETELNVNGSETKNVLLKVDSEDKLADVYTGKVLIDDRSGAAYSQDITITLKDKSLVRKTFEYLAFGNTCKQVSLYQFAAIVLIIILIIIFLIRGPHYPYKFWNRVKAKTSVIVFLVVIFLIGLILVITVVGFPKTHTQVYNLTTSDSELTYEWLQDDKYVLDVSKFFYDPENTTLNYEVLGLKHIKSNSVNQKITFYPDPGWSGAENAKIRAYDNMGGEVISPKFTLIVRDVPRKSAVELYNIYCWYVNLFIFAIILLLIFTAVFVKQTRRGRK